MLQQMGSTSLLLAAGSALAPFALSGCSNKPGGGGGGTSGDKIKVGILHSLTGTMAISEKSLKDVELMAIDEINKAGGVLGKQVEAIVEDPQSKFTDVFPEKAKKLLLKDKVVAVFGCWTSVSRKNVKPVFEENNGLLFYPVQYEGNECSKNIVYTGAAPNQQILPAVEWLMSEAGGSKKKFYLLGTDYVFPRTANLIIVRYLKSKGIDVLGEKYTPFEHKDYANIVQDIKKLDPDVIFSTINGDSNVNFYNELGSQGLPADKVPVVAVSVGEDELTGLDPSKVKGQLAAWNYFQSVDTPKNKEFVKNFKAKYGADRVTDDPIEAAYIGVYLWKLAVEKAGSTDVDKVREAFKSNIEFEAPSGKIKLDPMNQHIYKPFMMGKVRDDKQFDVVYKTDPIKPDPFPQVAFPGWGCDWTKGGETKGQEVKIQ
ncbi:ABC transporter substrate-binding protein [Planctomycetaceae bacterium SCGC AG-212-F19]|nr:ABC transporter substrate-binding protein [Planctomycetaceae bacterium SCGC AG-212-F19]